MLSCSFNNNQNETHSECESRELKEEFKDE